MTKRLNRAAMALAGLALLAAGQAGANTITSSKSEARLSAWVTGYTYWDNTPPGSATIARPVVHDEAGGIGTWPALLWSHLVYVLPYVFIVLRPAWRDLDPRLARTAATLGRSRWAFRWQVQRPLLAAPIAGAAAVGFAVSTGQFLATQMLGAGRLPTVTTEAVTLASGGDRRTAAAFALLQALLPLLAFGAARLVHRRAVR